MAKPLNNKLPTYRQLVRALEQAQDCMLDAANNWPEIPGRIRFRLLRCADRATALLARIPSHLGGAKKP